MLPFGRGTAARGYRFEAARVLRTILGVIERECNLSRRSVRVRSSQTGCAWDDSDGVTWLRPDMGAKGGLNPEVMLAAINAGSGRNSATESKFPAAVLTRSFDYGAEMHILMKDIDLAVAQGEEFGVPMWVCEATRLVFKHAMHKGAAKEDLTAIVKYIERDADFEMPKTR
jgi:hypothetical protein